MGERRCVNRGLVEKPEFKSHLENPGLEGGIILKWIFRKWNGGHKWIDLSQDRARWRALVNVVMQLKVNVVMQLKVL
jgi:hypothetical protein